MDLAAELVPAFALVASVLAVACNVPYLWDTLRGTTVPHRGSWLIWSMLEVVAVMSQHADGARWSLVPLAVQAVGTCLVFALSVRLGRGGLSTLDLALLGLAGVGLAGWYAVEVPVIATACVVAADLVAALMMVPKAWTDPHSETLSTFVLASLSGALVLGAVGSSSVSLLIYPLYFVAVNAGLAGVIIWGRRRFVRSVAAAPGATVPAGSPA